MKTKFRTPRKILSVFLCILMLTTSVVIANPFTASAATAFNLNPGIKYPGSYSEVKGPVDTHSSYEYDWWWEDDTMSSHPSADIWYSVYDLNPETTNYVSFYPRGGTE